MIVTATFAARVPLVGAQRVDVLPAVDPACAWGSALPWPALRDPAARPARRVGATAILVDGELAVWLEPKARRIATGDLPTETIELALAVGLPRVAARARRRELLIELIDGVPAAESPLARVLLAGSARADYRGLVVSTPPPSVAPPPPPRSSPPPATPVMLPPTSLASREQQADSTTISDDTTGLDFEAVDDDPELEDPEDVDAEPDAEVDFGADA